MADHPGSHRVGRAVSEREGRALSDKQIARLRAVTGRKALKKSDKLKVKNQSRMPRSGPRTRFPRGGAGFTKLSMPKD